MWGRERSSSSSSSFSTNLMAITRCKGLTESSKRCVRRMGRNNNDHKWIQNHFRRLLTSLVFLYLSTFFSSIFISLIPLPLFFFVVSDVVVVVLDAGCSWCWMFLLSSCLSSAPSIIFFPGLTCEVNGNQVTHSVISFLWPLNFYSREFFSLLILILTHLL